MYMPIATSRNEPELNLRRLGLPSLTRSAKPLPPPKLTESDESQMRDQVYEFQDER